MGGVYERVGAQWRLLSGGLYVPVVPGMAMVGVATPGSGQLDVTVIAPLTGGSALTAITYRVYRASDDTIVATFAGDGSTVSHRFSGLTNGVAVYARVTVSNAAGDGLESDPSSVVTPSADTPIKPDASNTGVAFGIDGDLRATVTLVPAATAFPSNVIWTDPSDHTLGGRMNIGAEFNGHTFDLIDFRDIKVSLRADLANVKFKRSLAGWRYQRPLGPWDPTAIPVGQTSLFQSTGGGIGNEAHWPTDITFEDFTFDGNTDDPNWPVKDGLSLAAGITNLTMTRTRTRGVNDGFTTGNTNGLLMDQCLIHDLQIVKHKDYPSYSHILKWAHPDCIQFSTPKMVNGVVVDPTEARLCRNALIKRSVLSNLIPPTTGQVMQFAGPIENVEFSDNWMYGTAGYELTGGGVDRNHLSRVTGYFKFLRNRMGITSQYAVVNPQYRPFVTEWTDNVYDVGGTTGWGATVLEGQEVPAP